MGTCRCAAGSTCAQGGWSCTRWRLRGRWPTCTTGEAAGGGQLPRLLTPSKSWGCGNPWLWRVVLCNAALVNEQEGLRGAECASSRGV